jgi:hypothetical protein
VAIKHKDGIPPGTVDDASIIKASYWPKDHDVSGGNHGSLMMRSTGTSDGADWLQSVALGMVLASQGVGTAPIYTNKPPLLGIVFPLTDPASPPDGLFWVTSTGTSPTGLIEIKLRVAGTTHVLAAIPF